MNIFGGEKNVTPVALAVAAENRISQTRAFFYKLSKV